MLDVVVVVISSISFFFVGVGDGDFDFGIEWWEDVMEVCLILCLFEGINDRGNGVVCNGNGFFLFVIFVWFFRGLIWLSMCFVFKVFFE